MIKKISNLGKELSRKELQTIQGNGLCDDGGFACMCSFHFVGCYTSIGACQTMCESAFPGGHGFGFPI